VGWGGGGGGGGGFGWGVGWGGVGVDVAVCCGACERLLGVRVGGKWGYVGCGVVIGFDVGAVESLVSVDWVHDCRTFSLFHILIPVFRQVFIGPND
jgi:hypothetical protein